MTTTSTNQAVYEERFITEYLQQSIEWWRPLLIKNSFDVDITTLSVQLSGIDSAKFGAQSAPTYAVLIYCSTKPHRNILNQCKIYDDDKIFSFHFISWRLFDLHTSAVDATGNSFISSWHSHTGKVYKFSLLNCYAADTRLHILLKVISTLN